MEIRGSTKLSSDHSQGYASGKLHVHLVGCWDQCGPRYGHFNFGGRAKATSCLGLLMYLRGCWCTSDVPFNKNVKDDDIWGFIWSNEATVHRSKILGKELNTTQAWCIRAPRKAFWRQFIPIWCKLNFNAQGSQSSVFTIWNAAQPD